MTCGRGVLAVIGDGFLGIDGPLILIGMTAGALLEISPVLESLGSLGVPRGILTICLDPLTTFTTSEASCC